MANRKRKRPGHSSQAFDQKVKPDLATTASKPLIKHQVLEQYYPQVLTLREHLLLKLPVESKIRRRKLSTAGLHGAEACNGSINAEDKLLRYALDTTLVGSPYTTKTKKQDDRSDKWLEHAASCETSDITFQGGTAGLSCFQAEVKFILRYEK